MNITQQISSEIAQVLMGNTTYESYDERWRFMLESYLGGLEYRQSGHLTRYQLESDVEYRARLLATPLVNHCSSVINVYNSFLFRTLPTRDYGTLAGMPELMDFIEDADFEGRNLNQFMKDVHTWSSVFGHSWIMCVKPNIGSTNRGQDQAAGVRPYLSLLTPQVVLDWSYTRLPNGAYVLDYFRYIEEINGSVRVVKTWTPTTIQTQTVDVSKNVISSDFMDINQLGMIPAVIAYNKRSSYRSIGISDIADIADLQRFIYNSMSEVDQSIRMNTHPSLVKTPDTSAGVGAGSLIEMPTDIDPGLKPYLLSYDGASVDSIYTAIQQAVDDIDKMANTGAVRATESRKVSGVAMQTEFELLNARLSEKADNLELAEEQIFKLFAMYMDREWTGVIEYPGSFNIRDTADEITQLKIARETVLPGSVAASAIDLRVLEWLDISDEEMALIVIEPHIMQSPQGELRAVTTQAQHQELSALGWIEYNGNQGESDGVPQS